MAGTKLGLEPMLGRLQDAWPDEQRKTATSGSAPPQACVPTATWKFPSSAQHGFRTYQKTMSNAALLENTLVSLPTGMGKTLIASVVMHNFLQWFPSGTVVFMAPTRPLVQQQVGACCRSVGLSPDADALMLTGDDLPDTRAALWRSRRLVFCTPHVLRNDLKNHVVDGTSSPNPDPNANPSPNPNPNPEPNLNPDPTQARASSSRSSTRRTTPRARATRTPRWPSCCVRRAPSSAPSR